jgi:5-formyltetrahydrofolate cyclo-ligase
VSSEDLKRAKRRVRREVLAARDAVDPAVRVRDAAAIMDRLFALDEVAEARVVMAFWSFGSEPPTDPLLDRLAAAGVTVALPRIEEGDLMPRSWRPGDPTTETRFGAREPTGDPVDPTTLDVIVTPSVAYDTDGRRIGYGGGFYDRLFPRAPEAFRVGIAFDLQVLTGPLPSGAFDVRVHALVTPSRTLRIEVST